MRIFLPLTVHLVKVVKSHTNLIRKINNRENFTFQIINNPNHLFNDNIRFSLRFS